MEVGDVVMEVVVDVVVMVAVVDVVVMVAIHFGLCNLYGTYCGRYDLLTIECPITSYVVNVEIVYSFEYCLSHRKAPEGILKTRSVYSCHAHGHLYIRTFTAVN